MIHTIITHPGGSHKDEFLAVCVLAAKFGAPIKRREPQVADLDDNAIAVVDIGGRHEPLMMNFDHHQFPRDHPPTCSLSLVLDHLGLYEDAVTFCDWLEPAEWFDSRGPKRTSEWLGVPRKVISQLNSPIDITALRRFASTTELSPGQPLYEFMRFVGDDLLSYLSLIRERIEYTAQHAERWAIPHGNSTIEVIYLPRKDPLPDEPSASVDSLIRDQGLRNSIAATVYPDRRGGGYGIRRFNDHPRLDFSKVEHEPDVRFAHKSGFMCKTTATEPSRLKALISAAWSS